MSEFYEIAATWDALGDFPFAVMGLENDSDLVPAVHLHFLSRPTATQLHEARTLLWYLLPYWLEICITWRAR